MSHEEPREDVGTDDETIRRDAAAGTPAETQADVPATPAPRRPLWQRVAQLLMPAVLASGAMGVHWVVNVPDVILESPNDQGAKDKDKEKAAKDKKKKDAERRRAQKQRDEARTPEQLEADWATYAKTPFDDEPTRTAWARRHQVVINRAVVEARKQAFAGAPEEPNVVLTSTTCRTVRCRFMLRSAFPHELDLMTSTLERLQESGEPVWRSFEVEPVPVEAAKPELEAKHAVEVIVTFVDDDTEASALEIPPATPAVEGGEPENGGEPNEAGEPNEDGEPEPENGGEPNENGA